MAFFSDEEKLAVLKAMLDSPDAVFDDQETALLTAIVADYETKAAGIVPDHGLGEFRAAAEQGEDTLKAMANGFKPVDSSNLAALKHVGQTGELTVRFKNGTAYTYFGVSRDVYDQIINANSPGSMFHAGIVRVGFAHEKLPNWK